MLLNQPNYSRWLAKYHDNLLNVEKTHPDLINHLENGSFGIKRTNHNFSRQPTDYTLETTINVHAKSKMQGISHLTKSINARQRWVITNILRASVNSYTYNFCGLEKNKI